LDATNETHGIETKESTSRHAPSIKRQKLEVCVSVSGERSSTLHAPSMKRQKLEVVSDGDDHEDAQRELMIYFQAFGCDVQYDHPRMYNTEVLSFQPRQKWYSGMFINSCMAHFSSLYERCLFLPWDFPMSERLREAFVPGPKSHKYDMIVTILNNQRQHWVAVFWNLQTLQLYYFDPYGDAMSGTVREFCVQIQHWIQLLHPEVSFPFPLHVYQPFLQATEDGWSCGPLCVASVETFIQDGGSNKYSEPMAIDILTKRRQLVDTLLEYY
jgi:hypothetical protein